ncbi:MAG: hypothetical protein IJ593_00495 [Lachnospiraceae bacterium]|nr:hypothetical protein [Lachnospiraceae bacterium]
MEKIIMKSKYINTNLANKEYFIRDPFKDKSIVEYDELYGKGSYKEDVTKRMLNAEFQLQNELKRQYMDTDLRKIFQKHGEKEIMDFLNKFMECQIDKYKKQIYYHPNYVGFLTDETRNKFIKLSNTVKKEKGKELTTKEFFKLYRDCYEIAPIYMYPKEATDYFVYSHENGFNYVEDYYIINELKNIDYIKDWENKDLARYEITTYVHRSYDYKIDAKMYQLNHGLHLYRNNKTGVWTLIFRGWIDVCIRTIKQYIGLREMGYNLAIDAKKVLEYYDYEIKYVKMKIEEDRLKKEKEKNENDI